MTDYLMWGPLSPDDFDKNVICAVGWNDQSMLSHTTNMHLAPATHWAWRRVDGALVELVKACEKHARYIGKYTEKTEKHAPNYRVML